MLICFHPFMFAWYLFLVFSNISILADFLMSSLAMSINAIFVHSIVKIIWNSLTYMSKMHNHLNFSFFFFYCGRCRLLCIFGLFFICITFGLIYFTFHLLLFFFSAYFLCVFVYLVSSIYFSLSIDGQCLLCLCCVYLQLDTGLASWIAWAAQSIFVLWLFSFSNFQTIERFFNKDFASISTAKTLILWSQNHNFVVVFFHLLILHWYFIFVTVDVCTYFIA